MSRYYCKDCDLLVRSETCPICNRTVAAAPDVDDRPATDVDASPPAGDPAAMFDAWKNIGAVLKAADESIKTAHSFHAQLAVSLELCAGLEDRLSRARAEYLRAIAAYDNLNHAISQTLGRALHYPLNDCDRSQVEVGEHTAETLAGEAARRMAELETLLGPVLPRAEEEPDRKAAEPPAEESPTVKTTGEANAQKKRLWEIEVSTINGLDTHLVLAPHTAMSEQELRDFLDEQCGPPGPTRVYFRADSQRLPSITDGGMSPGYHKRVIYTIRALSL